MRKYALDERGKPVNINSVRNQMIDRNLILEIYLSDQRSQVRPHGRQFRFPLIFLRKVSLLSPFKYVNVVLWALAQSNTIYKCCCIYLIKRENHFKEDLKIKLLR